MHPTALFCSSRLVQRGLKSKSGSPDLLLVPWARKETYAFGIPPLGSVVGSPRLAGLEKGVSMEPLQIGAQHGCRCPIVSDH